MRDKPTARRFLRRAAKLSGEPEIVTIDKSGANKAGIDDVNEGREIPIHVRQIKYLNNIVEQDHRSINASLIQ